MKCPICKKEASAEGEFYPFCSERCKIIDLGNWASPGPRPTPTSASLAS
jgi:uncharacterized protein